MKFKASLDNLAKGITISTTILFAIVIIAQLIISISHHSYATIIIPVLLIVVYLITYFYRPVNYNITNSELIIHRPLKDVIIKKENIKSVQLIPKDIMKRTIRTFGVGGVFGYFGNFLNTQLGSMTWYATQRDKAVLIATVDNKKVVVTPDEPENFIKQLNLLEIIN